MTLRLGALTLALLIGSASARAAPLPAGGAHAAPAAAVRAAALRAP
jgi:hypothetical protein